MATLRGITTKFEFAADGAQLAGINRAVAGAKTGLQDAAKAAAGFREQVAGAFSGLRGVIAGYLTLGTVKLFTLDFARDAEAIRKTSEAIGMSAESYQVWAAAAKSAGVETEPFNAILGKLSKNAAEAARGQGELVQVFSRAGIAVRDASGKVLPLEKLLGNVSDAFTRLPAGPERTRLALKLFEEQGSKLLPFLTKGSKGVEELRQRMLKAGIIIGDGTLAQAKKFEAAKKSLQAGLLGIRNTIGSAILPYLVKAIQWFQRWLSVRGGMKDLMNVLKAVGIVLAGVVAGMVVAKVIAFAGSVWKAVAAFKAMGAAAALSSIAVALIPALIALLILAIEDVYSFMKGKDSILGRMIGEDNAEKIRAAKQWITDFVEGVALVFGFLGEGLTAIGEGVEAAWDWLLSLPGKARKLWEGFKKWLEEPPKTKGWLGVVEDTLWVIVKAVEAAINGLRKLNAMMGMEEIKGETIDENSDLGRKLSGADKKMVKDLGLPEEYATGIPDAGPSIVAAAAAAKAHTPTSALDFSAIANYAALHPALQRTIQEPASWAPNNAGVEIVRREVLPQVTVNVSARTDADPAEIARVAGEEITRRVRAAQDALRGKGDDD